MGAACVKAAASQPLIGGGANSRMSGGGAGNGVAKDAPPRLPVVDCNALVAAMAKETPLQLHAVALGLAATLKASYADHDEIAGFIARLETSSHAAAQFKNDLLLAFLLPRIAPAPDNLNVETFYPPGTVTRLLAKSCVPSTVFGPYLPLLDPTDLHLLFHAALKLVHEDSFTALSSAHRDVLLLCAMVLERSNFPLPVDAHSKAVLQRACVLVADPTLLRAMCRTKQTSCIELWEQMRRFNLSTKSRISVLATALSHLELEDALALNPDFQTTVQQSLMQRGRVPSRENKQALFLVTSALGADDKVPLTQMHIFCKLYQLLDDAALHLISDPWKDFAILLRRRDSPDDRWPFSADCLGILLGKALDHDSPAVRKLVLGRLLSEPYDFNEQQTHWVHSRSLVCGALLSCLNSKDLYSHSMLQAAGIQLGLTEASVGASGGRHARKMRHAEERTEVDGFDLTRGLETYFAALARSDPTIVTCILEAIPNTVSSLNATLAAANALSFAAACLPKMQWFGAPPDSSSVARLLALHRAPVCKFWRAELLSLHLGYLVLRVYPPSVALDLLASYLPDHLLVPNARVLVHGLDLCAHAVNRFGASSLAALAADSSLPIGARALAASWLADPAVVLVNLVDNVGSMDWIVAVLRRQPSAILSSPIGITWAANYACLPLLVCAPKQAPHLVPIATEVLRSAVRERHLTAVAALAPILPGSSTELLGMVDFLLAQSLPGPSNTMRWEILRQVKSPAIAQAAREAFEKDLVDSHCFSSCLACLDASDPVASQEPLKLCLASPELLPTYVAWLFDNPENTAPKNFTKRLKPALDLFIKHSSAGASSDPLRFAIARLFSAWEAFSLNELPLDVLVTLSRHEQHDEAGNMEWGTAQTVRCVTRLVGDEQGMIHPAASIRFSCLAFLSKHADDEAVPLLCHRLLRDLTKESKAEDMRDIHDAQTLLVLGRRVGEQGTVEQATRLVCAVVRKPSLPDEVRFRIETVLSDMARRYWTPVLDVLLAELVDDVETPQLAVGSALMALGTAWFRVPEAEKQKSALRLHAAVAPWTRSSRSILRVLAISMSSLAAECVPLECSACMRGAERIDKRTLKLIRKIRDEQIRTEPKVSFSALLSESVPTLLGEMCAQDLLVDRIANLVREHMREVWGANNFADEEAGMGRPAEAATPAPADEQPFHQRKIDVDELGDARQGLVVVASLLDKAPNLGGLTRTCEVWRARTLVLADLSIVSDQEFQAVSVSAEQWVPMVQAKPGKELEDYLSALKHQEGYVIVGLEQTLESVALQEFKWPTHGRVCLVLGNEKAGVPASLMSRLDATVEIPQLGMVRSLNVHVSASSFIWEYTRNELKV